MCTLCTFFDVLLPKKMDLRSIGIQESLVEWGGEFFSQEPKKFIWENALFLIQHECNEISIKNLLDENISKNGYP
ncbi:hypothetical protein Xszus_01353 [Xenorhabdus szentirmaii]|uniref:Uncharacterized protein n=1 Tax=Xenorhabdus szentirmaii DSM 16338 TaxID=1427518 RepID=W1J791_9GAMM|nr:hypothetical protein Xsze_02674 [Xenorhabdus szentirmaii DSM 16338]PHM41655.1 hypothetical protein Xszus_01353 [Xenorhabdus szentirmaii]CDL85355.1 hypothetical protein XSR1_70095 [Xenorhabdus szentirmaii DSM 16338]